MLLQKIEEIGRAAVQAVFEVEIDRISIDFTDKFGDLAVNCFHLAKALRQAPPKIAAALASHLVDGEVIKEAEATSGYVNLVLTDRALFEGALLPCLENPDLFGGQVVTEDADSAMVEFSSPNTNKPQHLGHVRNNCLGDSIARILTATGIRVARANLVNDRGIHICKSMLAYEREGQGTTPDSESIKGDHFVGKYYVLFETRFQEEKKAYEADKGQEITKEDFFKLSSWGQAAQEMLQKWESGDGEVIALWKLMNSWVLAGFKETYANLGIEFDQFYFESETYKEGKEIVNRGLESGVFYRRDDGAVEIDLAAEKLDKKVVLRSDGTSVYITQDLGTTVRKAEGLKMNRQVFVVGDEQIYHFKVLFSILDKLGYGWASSLYHLAYGMVNLPEGKMKSREGKVVDADDLMTEVAELAAKEINERGGAKDVDIEHRANKIGMAALKFMILSVAPKTTMTYDPKASVQFDGDTGPYVLYAFARIRRMIEDSGIDEGQMKFDAELLQDASERRLALKLLQFPRVVARAANDYNPSLVATFLLQLAHAYHSHNRAVKILKAEDPAVRQARLALSLTTSHTLKRGLGLLGIETVDRM
ncbi:MAG: arginyl-tRNA synthetase [Planctomycetota bacterium]|jgi:arginyl-tRNA synthetase